MGASFFDPTIGRTPNRSARQRPVARIAQWICYYGLEADAHRYRDADLAVFNARWHPPLVGGGPRPCYCGYVSLGEVDSRGELWPLAAGQGFLVRPNPRWGTWVVDVRDRRWQAILTDRVVPEVLAQGFDGLFCDTLDAALSLAAWNDADTFACLRRAVADIFAVLRRRHPRIVMVVNRGLAILGDLAPLIDAVVIEGLYSVFDPACGDYRPVPEPVRGQLLHGLAAGLAGHPGLPVLSLDYAPHPGHRLALAAAAFARRNGFVPYVGSANLDCFFDPPGKGLARPAGGQGK